MIKFLSRFALWILPLSWLLAVVHTDVNAQLRLTPTRLLVKAPQRWTKITAINTSAEESEVAVGFKYGYQEFDTNGVPHVIIRPPVGSSERSAVGWLRAFPDRFTMPGNTSQVVRIMASPPAGLPDGEYWARVTFASEPTVEKKAQPGTAVRSRFRMISASDVPYHYRTGSVTTGLSIGNVTTAIVRDSLRVTVDLIRNGNASYWGTATLRLKDESGKVVGLSKNGLVMYEGGIAPFFIRRGSIPPGAYTLEMSFVTESSSPYKEYIISADPVKSTATITMP